MEPRTWEALAAAAALEGRTPSDLARFWIELELGFADEAKQGPGKAGRRSLSAGSAKTSRTRTSKKTRPPRRDV